MCLAIPMQIESLNGDTAKVSVAGTHRDVCVTFIDEPKVGDFVLIHAGFAIKKIDEMAAKETLELLGRVDN